MDPWIADSLTKGSIDAVTARILEKYVQCVFAAPINLTGFTPAQFWDKGVLDALSLLSHSGLASASALQCVDIGSGSGLPGMVLAIMRPGWGWTLVESRARRAEFLLNTATLLRLDNVKVVGERAEVWVGNSPSMREHFDLVTARAVGPMLTALELALPLAAIGGTIALPLGVEGVKSVAVSPVVAALGGEFRQEDAAETVSGIAIIRKMRSTPHEFPRIGSKLGRFSGSNNA